jgi:hypothetical protein
MKALALSSEPGGKRRTDAIINLFLRFLFLGRGKCSGISFLGDIYKVPNSNFVSQSQNP